MLLANVAERLDAVTSSTCFVFDFDDPGMRFARVAAKLASAVGESFRFFDKLLVDATSVCDEVFGITFGVIGPRMGREIRGGSPTDKGPLGVVSLRGGVVTEGFDTLVFSSNSVSGSSVLPGCEHDSFDLCQFNTLSNEDGSLEKTLSST